MGGLKMNVIEIKNLTKSYGKARGITDVSFNVEARRNFWIYWT